MNIACDLIEVQEAYSVQEAYYVQEAYFVQEAYSVQVTCKVAHPAHYVPVMEICNFVPSDYSRSVVLVEAVWIKMAYSMMDQGTY